MRGAKTETQGGGSKSEDSVCVCVSPCLQDRRAFLQYAAKGCLRFDLNRPAWALESDVKQLGGLIYW